MRHGDSVLLQHNGQPKGGLQLLNNGDTTPAKYEIEIRDTVIDRSRNCDARSNGIDAGVALPLIGDQASNGLQHLEGAGSVRDVGGCSAEHRPNEIDEPHLDAIKLNDGSDHMTAFGSQGELRRRPSKTRCIVRR
jgi:hypothetical protein